MTETASSTFTIRVDDTTKQRLETLAKNTGRSRSYLAAQAIDSYLSMNEWQVEGIRAAIASADRDGVIPHEEFLAWADVLGTPAERLMPEPRKT